MMLVLYLIRTDSSLPWNDGAEKNLYADLPRMMFWEALFHSSSIHRRKRIFLRTIILNQQSSPFQREVRHHRNRAGLLLLSSVTVLHDTEELSGIFIYQ